MDLGTTESVYLQPHMQGTEQPHMRDCATSGAHDMRNQVLLDYGVFDTGSLRHQGIANWHSCGVLGSGL